MGSRGDGAEHHHRDRDATECDAKPSEDDVSHFTTLLVHAEAQHCEEDTGEHHHDGNDFVRAFLRVEDGRNREYAFGHKTSPRKLVDKVSRPRIRFRRK